MSPIIRRSLLSLVLLTACTSPSNGGAAPSGSTVSVPAHPAGTTHSCPMPTPDAAVRRAQNKFIGRMQPVQNGLGREYDYLVPGLAPGSGAVKGATDVLVRFSELPGPDKGTIACGSGFMVFQSNQKHELLSGQPTAAIRFSKKIPDATNYCVGWMPPTMVYDQAGTLIAVWMVCDEVQ